MGRPYPTTPKLFPITAKTHPSTGMSRYFSTTPVPFTSAQKSFTSTPKSLTPTPKSFTPTPKSFTPTQNPNPTTPKAHPMTPTSDVKKDGARKVLGSLFCNSASTEISKPSGDGTNAAATHHSGLFKLPPNIVESYEVGFPNQGNSLRVQLS
jgi:hypothetical protein